MVPFGPKIRVVRSHDSSSCLDFVRMGVLEGGNNQGTMEGVESSSGRAKCRRRGRSGRMPGLGRRESRPYFGRIIKICCVRVLSYSLIHTTDPRTQVPSSY
jgi:hypothetical protein